MSDLIRELYSPEVAAQILAIPISSCGVTDKLLWPHTTQHSMHKPMMHNMLIRVTTREYQGECPVVEGWQVLLTVEGHWQSRCKWSCFAYVAKPWADR
nr:hypothetical protein CFP56_05245 [Quercus suber]